MGETPIGAKTNRHSHRVKPGYLYASHLFVKRRTSVYRKIEYPSVSKRILHVHRICVGQRTGEVRKQSSTPSTEGETKALAHRFSLGSRKSDGDCRGMWPNQQRSRMPNESVHHETGKRRDTRYGFRRIRLQKKLWEPPTIFW